MQDRWYRGGYGHAIAYDSTDAELRDVARQAFGRTAVYFSAAKMLKESKEHVKEVLTNANSKA